MCTVRPLFQQCKHLFLIPTKSLCLKKDVALCFFYAIVHPSHQTAAADRCRQQEIEMIEKIKQVVFVAVAFVVIMTVSIAIPMAMNPATWR